MILIYNDHEMMIVGRYSTLGVNVWASLYAYVKLREEYKEILNR